MIPRRYIDEWKSKVPWRNNEQVEQDLLICRTLLAIFSDEFLRENLAFRGGTALHKLYLNPAPRYSEDIDLVQIKPGPIKPILDQIEKAVTFFEEKRSVKQKANNNTILYRFNSEFPPSQKLKLKIEINCREHFNLLGWKSFPFQMESDWFSGKCEITTYQLEELLGTKLRALYQRKKGRDLFDLYYADINVGLDFDEVIDCYEEYMRFAVGKPPTARQFQLNIQEKKSSKLFNTDLDGLLRDGVEYEISKAFDWMDQAIIERL